MIPIDVFAADALPGALDGSDPGVARLAVVIGPHAECRLSAARAIARAWAHNRPKAVVVNAPAPAEWPFRHPLVPELPDGPVVVWAEDVHEAFVNRQTGSTRLVTTQPAYLFETWNAALAGREGALLLATADLGIVKAHAPEVLARRGPFSSAFVYEAEDGTPSLVAPEGELRHVSPERPVAAQGRTGGQTSEDGPTADAGEALLVQAFRCSDPAERLALCVHALEGGRTAPHLLAVASACMEVNDLDAAERDLDAAVAHAPEWAAAHFERGKLWLRRDDMKRAGGAFREAAERLPTFASAWANLGATLGELDRPEEALAAFQHALAADPDSHAALNNVGVVSRELGRLSESEAAFRRVIGLVPDLAFGHYNLGHTLFLQGRYHAALAAYTEGQRRDPERNPVQASRVALCRLATGDGDGAIRDLQQASVGLPKAYRQQLLGDASAVAWALLTHKPDLPGWKDVNDWLTRERAD